MAFIEYDVQELSSPLKIEESVMAYAEAQMGPERNTRYMQRLARVRLGLQVSPENFFYDETAFVGAQYVNIKALEFTVGDGTGTTTAEAAVYDTFTGTELFAVESGTPAVVGPPAVDAVVTGALKLKVNPELIEQIEVREGDTYELCDALGAPVEKAIHQIHLSLKSSNKPDFTFYEWHPQPKYRFNRQCNIITDMTDDTMTAGYMGVNNYVLSPALFEVVLGIVEGL